MKELVHSLFVLLALLSFFLLVAASYQAYQRSLELAKMSDVACLVATQLCMGDHAGVLDPKNLSLEGTYLLGRENFRFGIRVFTLNGQEIGSETTAPERRVEVEFPVLLGETPARLKVMVWRGG